MHAISAVSSLLSLSLAFVSDSFLVELDHLRAFVFVPERSVLGRNGGSASSAVETMAIRALVRMEAVIVVISLLISGVFLHDIVAPSRIATFSFFASVGKLSSFFSASIIPSVFLALFSFALLSFASLSFTVSFWIIVAFNSRFGIGRIVLLSVFLEVFSFRRLIFAIASSSSSGVVTVKFGVNKTVLIRVIGPAIDGHKNGFLLGRSS